MSRLAWLAIALGMAACGGSPAPAATIPDLSAARPRCTASWPDQAVSIPLPASECPQDPEATTSLPHAELAFPDAATATATATKIDAELAKTAHDVEKGLMYRRSMGDDHGMFFKLDGRRDHAFWMHHTCISLDMLFVEEDGTIVGIVEGAAPMSDALRKVGCDSSYVVEVNGGWSRRHGVKPGQRITIPSKAL